MGSSFERGDPPLKKVVFLRLFILFLLVILSLLSSPLGAQGGAYYAHYDYLLFNEVFPVWALQDFFFVPNTLTEDFLLDRKVETGWRLEGESYYLGIIFIEEQQIFIPSSTLIFLEDYFVRKDLRQEVYPARYYEMNQFLSGFVVGRDLYSCEERGLYIGGGVKYLQGDELIWRDYTGFMTHENHLSLERASAYSSVAKQSQIVEDRMEARGWSLDVNLSLDLFQHFQLQFTGENLYSRIHWQDVFTVRGSYNTENLRMDESGYFFYVPIFEPGSYWTYATYYSSLIKEYHLSLGYQDWIELGVIHRLSPYPYLRVRLLSGSFNLWAGLLGDLYTVSGEYQGLTWDLASESLQIEESTALVARLGWRFSF